MVLPQAFLQIQGINLKLYYQTDEPLCITCWLTVVPSFLVPLSQNVHCFWGHFKIRFSILQEDEDESVFLQSQLPQATCRRGFVFVCFKPRCNSSPLFSKGIRVLCCFSICRNREPTSNQCCVMAGKHTECFFLLSEMQNVHVCALIIRWKPKNQTD